MKKILIIEDEIAISRALKDELQDLKYEVSIAADGQEGLDTALKSHPDLILLDVRLPVMDGIAVLKKLREDTWGKDVKVLLLTNSASMEHIAEATELGSLGYLVKSDSDITKVLEKVQEVVGS